MDEESIALLNGVDVLCGASVYLSDQWDVRMKRDQAQANLEARAILFNCSNKIFAEYGCGITRAEVEGAIIIERNVKS